MKAPRLLFSSETSDCCNAPAMLVRSRQGGLVSRDCLKCGRSSYVRQDQLPELTCELCDGPLVAAKLDGRNYHYACVACKRGWKLADYLPHWSEVFPYSGLAAHGDGQFD
jgi:hypothetical protein